MAEVRVLAMDTSLDSWRGPVLAIGGSEVERG